MPTSENKKRFFGVAVATSRMWGSTPPNPRETKKTHFRRSFFLTASRAGVQVDIYSIQQAWQAAQPFMDFLQQKGFYVPQCARSNFPKTYLSLAASMNMNYLQSFGVDLIKAGINYEDWGIYAKWGAVRQTLAGLPGNKVSSNCLTSLTA